MKTKIGLPQSVRLSDLLGVIGHRPAGIARVGVLRAIGLCCVVAIFVMRPFPDEECVPIGKICESSTLRIIENIDVINIPPEIDSISINHDGAHLLRSEFLFGDDVTISPGVKNTLDNKVHWFRSVKRRLEREVGDQEARPVGYLISGGLAVVVQNNPVHRSLWRSAIDNDYFGICRYVGSKLSLGGILGATDEACRGHPQKRSKDHKQGIGDFQPVSKERRPEFGSLIGSVLGLWIGWFCLVKRDDYKGIGFVFWRRAIVFFGYCLGMSSIFGILVGLDPWSILMLGIR